jgi:hypothetical protein
LMLKLKINLSSLSYFSSNFWLLWLLHETWQRRHVAAVAPSLFIACIDSVILFFNENILWPMTQADVYMAG